MDHIHPASEAVVIILVGLIASGKSTFAQALEHHFPNFRRCNQDDLGNRRLVENLVRQSLREGKSVCVDRTNFNPQQRSYWIDIARAFPSTAVWVIVFDTPYETCAARLRERTSHPTIRNAEEGLSILARFASDFRQPTQEEGYDRIVHLSLADQPSLPAYTHEQVLNILRRVRDSPPVVSSHPPSWRTPNLSDNAHTHNIRIRGHTRGRSSGGRRNTTRTFLGHANNSRGRVLQQTRGRSSGPFMTQGLPDHDAGPSCQNNGAGHGSPDGIAQDMARNPLLPERATVISAAYSSDDGGGGSISDKPVTIIS